MIHHLFRSSLMVVVVAGVLAGYGCSRSADDSKCADGQPCTAPSDGQDEAPAKLPRRIWADSFLFCDAPSLEVATWLTEKPELEGKYVLIEFWRTWCGACKRTVPLLNSFHEKYGKELVVIAVTGEPEATVRAYGGPKMNYFMALDKPGTTEVASEAGAATAPVAHDTEVASEAGAATAPVAHDQDADGQDAQADPANGFPDQDRDGVIKDQGLSEERFGVWGWPHVVILEPEHRCVVWEGFPLLPGYELTHEKIERILAVGREHKAAKAAKKP